QGASSGSSSSNCSTMAGPAPIANGIAFFRHIPGLESIIIDLKNLLSCGPLKARPQKPSEPIAPNGTNMIYFGILMGDLNAVFKPAKWKSSQKWQVTSRVGHDTFLRLDKNGNIKFCESSGTIIAENDIWYHYGY